MTTKEMYAIVPNAQGCRKLPNGFHVKLGNGVTLGNGVKLGDYVTLGNGVTLGDYVTLGNGVTLGNSPLQIHGPKFLIYPHSPGKIGIGCEIHTFAEWDQVAASLADEHSLDLELHWKYGKLLMEWMEINMPVEGVAT